MTQKKGNPVVRNSEASLKRVAVVTNAHNFFGHLHVLPPEVLEALKNIKPEHLPIFCIHAGDPIPKKGGGKDA